MNLRTEHESHMLNDGGREGDLASINQSVIQNLADMVGDDGVVSLIDLCIQDFPEHVEQCINAAQTGALDKVKASAHPMKSGARYLGAVDFSELCAEIETEALKGQLDKVRELVGHLSKRYNQAANGLCQMRDALNNKPHMTPQ